MARVTSTEIRAYAEEIARVTEIPFSTKFQGGVVALTLPVGGTGGYQEVSPWLSKRELMVWMQAYLAGYRASTEQLPTGVKEWRPGMGVSRPEPLFSTPRILITPGAQRVISRAGDDPRVLLERHFFGDWGELDESDALFNHRGVLTKGMILSIYYTTDGQKIFVITDDGHVTTTILLPEER